MAQAVESGLFAHIVHSRASGQTLQELSSQHQAKCTEAEAEHNRNKNRFPDKLPSGCKALCRCVCTWVAKHSVFGFQIAHDSGVLSVPSLFRGYVYSVIIEVMF